MFKQLYTDIKNMIDKMCLQVWLLNEEIYGQKYHENEMV